MALSRLSPVSRTASGVSWPAVTTWCFDPDWPRSADEEHQARLLDLPTHVPFVQSSASLDCWVELGADQRRAPRYMGCIPPRPSAAIDLLLYLQERLRIEPLVHAQEDHATIRRLFQTIDQVCLHLCLRLRQVAARWDDLLVSDVITASQPTWLAPFTGLSPRCFGALVTQLRHEGADSVRRGRPWSLTLEDRMLLVTAYWRTKLNVAADRTSVRRLEVRD